MVSHTNILLVNPKCLDRRISSQDDQVVPVGLYYIGALLIENGFNAAILNLANEQTNPVGVFRSELTRLQPDIIGFSITSPNRWMAIECADIARQENANTTIVFGGPAATFMADHLFDACPALDIIIPGEGEITFLELARVLSDNTCPIEKQVPGLIYTKGNIIKQTPARPLATNLDQFPHPSRYFTFQHLAMSRGCPGSCTFCGSPRFWETGNVRFHSAAWIADEIHTLYGKGVNHFYICDDTFTMDKPRVLELCRLIREKNLPITWNAISRVDYIDEDLLYAMRTAGCIQISFGVESGSQKIRQTLGKPIPEETIIKAFEITRTFGIMPRAYFIYGSPGETEQTINESVALMQKLKPLSAIFYMLVIFPGTSLYRAAKRKNKVSDTVWQKKIEDLPWFELDPDLDFDQIKQFGNTLRQAFYEHVHEFAQDISLVDQKSLYLYHADFLSRLAMTFSHGEYARDSRVKNPDTTAMELYEKALQYTPDPRAFLGLGMLMQKTRRLEDAMHWLSKGLKHHPDHADLNICLGVCMMNLGRFSDALEVFEGLGNLEQTRHYINICQKKISG